MDRMTVDVALEALTVAMPYYGIVTSALALYLVLALACLTRETGAVLPAAFCISELWSRRYKQAALWSTAFLPTLI
jgi:hypothetical protein